MSPSAAARPGHPAGPKGGGFRTRPATGPAGADGANYGNPVTNGPGPGRGPPWRRGRRRYKQWPGPARRRRLDRAGQRAWADNVALDLSARELQLLDILMSHADRVVTKELIAGELSGDGEEVGANAIEVYVHRLRKKLDGSNVGVRAVRGLGYLLMQQDGQAG